MSKKVVYESLDRDSTGKFERHDLDFDKTMDYFIDRIDCDTTLSKKTISMFDFKKGNFFTLLFEEARKDRLYDFSGGIFPSQLVEDPIEIQKMQQSAEKSSFLSRLDVGSFRVVKTMTRVCAEFIDNFLKSDPHHIAIMDQCIVEYANFNAEGVNVAFYQNEVHYLAYPNTPLESIKDALRDADHIWHLLVILTESLETSGKALSEQDLDTICKNAKYIITTAYDKEGYIFWERNSR